MTKVVVLSRRNITHPRAGGASVYVHEIFRRLTNEYDVTVVSEGGGSSKKIQEIDGLTYFNVRGGLMRVRLPYSYLKKFAKSADILIDNADVAIPWFSPLYAGKPIIAIIHQLVREVFYLELPRILATLGYFYEPAVYRLYSQSMIVAMSNSTADDLCRLGIPQRNIRIIGPGCSYPDHERVPLAMRSQRLIGCVSRLMRYKGLHYAIRALHRIEKELPDATLQIAGSGPYQRELHKLAHDIGVDSKVTFLGRVTERRKLELYRESRAIILSSIREGYGLSVIEANSFGTPAIGWNVPGLRDSIIDKNTGLLASFPHADDLTRQIYNIMTDDSAWNSMSEKAWRWANRHSWGQSARDFGETIELVLANQPAFQK